MEGPWAVRVSAGRAGTEDRRAARSIEEDSWATPSGEEVNHRASIIAVACAIGTVGFYDYHTPVFVWQIRGHLPQRLPNGDEALACANCAQIARAR